MLAVKNPVSFRRSLLALSVGLMTPIVSLTPALASERSLTSGPNDAGVRKTLLEVAGVKREVTVVDGVIHTVGASSGLASYSVINDGVINIVPGGVADWVGVAK
ncbi:hypothetical protein, partial [Pseudomonas petrae]|uniref:hypothetical protein n=1 Tax=Pseudomonas petrae TaxID=2912190 RepID=UPI001F2D7119